jgi:hypothetical protein
MARCLQVHVSAVVAAFGDDVDTVRLAALRTLLAHDITNSLVQEYEQQVVALEDDPSEEVRSAASYALQNAGLKQQSSLQPIWAKGDKAEIKKTLLFIATPEAPQDVLDQLPPLAQTIIDKSLKVPALTQPALDALRRLPPDVLAKYMPLIAERLSAKHTPVIKFVESLTEEHAPAIARCLKPIKSYDWLQRAALKRLAEMPLTVVDEQVCFAGVVRMDARSVRCRRKRSDVHLLAAYVRDAALLPHVRRTRSLLSLLTTQTGRSGAVQSLPLVRTPPCSSSIYRC